MVNSMMVYSKERIIQSYFCFRTIEIPQRTHIFKADHCLKVHNVPFKLASPIAG